MSQTHKVNIKIQVVYLTSLPMSSALTILAPSWFISASLRILGGGEGDFSPSVSLLLSLSELDDDESLVGGLAEGLSTIAVDVFSDSLGFTDDCFCHDGVPDDEDEVLDDDGGDALDDDIFGDLSLSSFGLMNVFFFHPGVGPSSRLRSSSRYLSLLETFLSDVSSPGFLNIPLIPSKDFNFPLVLSSESPGRMKVLPLNDFDSPPLVSLCLSLVPSLSLSGLLLLGPPGLS